MRLIGCFVLGIVLCCVDAIAGQEPGFKVTGVVKEVDAKLGTITVRRKSALEDESFSFLKRDIDVTEPTGKKTQIDALAKGQTVQLLVRPSGEVEAVAIQAASFLATVKDVDPSKRSVQIARPEKPLTTMPLAADAKILMVDRPAFLREIKPGSEMKVSTSLDGKTVLSLNLVTDPDGKLAAKLFPRIKVSKLPGERLVGVLTDFDAAKNELRLSGPKTKYVPKPFHLAKDARIQALYGQVAVQELRLQDVVRMASATVLVSPEKQATRVFVDPPTFRAKVKSLDGNAGKLTVEADGKDRVYALGKGFKVMFGTRVRRFADLEPNLPVTMVLSLDRQQLLAVDTRPQ